jgi:hypothetical protein
MDYYYYNYVDEVDELDDIDNINIYDIIIELLLYSVINTNTNYIHNQPEEKKKYIITDEVSASLIPIKFKDAVNKENNTTCSITLTDFDYEDLIIQLPCNHCFNQPAILQWLTEESGECPVCRYKLAFKEKINYLQINQNIINTTQS